MDYNKHYTQLIERARQRQFSGYAEKHHVVPRCLGGSDLSENIVRLTPEEHYVAHQLLAKIYPKNERLIYAAHCMQQGRATNKIYGWIKRRFKQVRHLAMAGSQSPYYGTRWIHNDELCQSRRIPAHEETPSGWKDGRRIKFYKPNVCETCGIRFGDHRRWYSRFCSQACKNVAQGHTSVKIIEDNFEAMMEYFTTCKSITKTLKHFGVTGSRAGNAKFSKLLKERGLQPLRRRNTPA
jgi:hypothetical protein